MAKKLSWACIVLLQFLHHIARPSSSCPLCIVAVNFFVSVSVTTVHTLQASLSGTFHRGGWGVGGGGEDVVNQCLEFEPYIVVAKNFFTNIQAYLVLFAIVV